MKTYKPIFLAKIFMLTVLILLISFSVYGMGDDEAPMHIRIFFVIIVLIGPVIAIGFIKFSVTVSADGIEVKSLPFIPGTGTLNWNEIAEVKGEYILFPETGIVSLIPKSETGKKFLRFSVMGMPIGLIRDILSNVPKDTKVYLYPYLKRRAEGKQIIFYK